MRRLLEKLNFDQLYSHSEPKRVLRARTVRGPSLDVEAYKGSMYYFFNFKAFPSTTGNRHKGYIKFLKPQDPRTPLERVPCVVDCDCPDYRYRWAWANKQRAASSVGPNSLNKAHNRAPKITNPRAKPGLCKHLLALTDFLYGQDSQFPASDDEGTSHKLEKLIQKSSRYTVTANGEGHPTSPQEQEQRMVSRTQARNRGENPDSLHVPPLPPTEEPETEVEDETPSRDNPQNNQARTPHEPNAPRVESLQTTIFKTMVTPLLEEIQQDFTANTGMSVCPQTSVEQPGDQALQLLGDLKEIASEIRDLLQNAGKDSQMPEAPNMDQLPAPPAGETGEPPVEETPDEDAVVDEVPSSDRDSIDDRSEEDDEEAA